MRNHAAVIVGILYLLRRDALIARHAFQALGGLTRFSMLEKYECRERDSLPTRQCTSSRLPIKDWLLTCSRLRCGPNGFACESTSIGADGSARRRFYVLLLNKVVLASPGTRQCNISFRSMGVCRGYPSKVCLTTCSPCQKCGKPPWDRGRVAERLSKTSRKINRTILRPVGPFQQERACKSRVRREP